MCLDGPRSGFLYLHAIAVGLLQRTNLVPQLEGDGRVIWSARVDRGLEIVPRRTIFGEWEAFGEGCWKWRVLLGLELRIFIAICALLQRMGFGPAERNVPRCGEADS